MAHPHARTVSLKLKVFALMVIITTLKKAVFEALTTFCGNIKLGGSSVSFSIDTQITIESGATLEMTGGTKIISGSGTITNLGTLTFSNPGMSVLFNTVNHGQITFSEETMPPSLTSYGKVAILKNVTVLNEFKARSSSVLEGSGGTVLQWLQAHIDKWYHRY